MKKKAGHVEDRAKERTTFSSGDIEKARLYVRRNKNKLKKGQTYSLSVPGKGYFVVGDVGTDKKNHVVKTVLGVGMNPPGTIIQNGLLERELVKAAEALFTLEKTANIVAVSLAELNFEKAASAYLGYTWEAWQAEDSHTKEAALNTLKTMFSGARGFVNRKGADALSRLGVSNKALAGSRQQAAKSYSQYARGLENQANQMSNLRHGANWGSARAGAKQTQAAQASARAAEQGRMGAQGMTGAAAQSEMAIAKAQQGHASRQLSAANKEVGLSQGARDSIQNVRTQQQAVADAEKALANATTRQGQAQAQAALAEQQRLLASAQKTQQGFKQQLRQRAEIRQMAAGGSPKPTTATPTTAPTTPTTGTTTPTTTTPTTPPPPVEEAGMNLKDVGLGVLGGGALAGGGYLGYQALQNRGQQMPKYASSHLWHDIKNKSDSMSDALTMYKEASQAMSTGQLLKDFGAGVDPFGTFTTGYAQQAQREGISEAQHKQKKALSTAGGLIGGATVVPSTIYGIVEGAKGLARGKGVGGKLMSGIEGFGRGFKQPLEEVYRASKANKALRQAAKSEDGLKLTSGQKKDLEFTLGKASVRDVASNLKSQGKGSDLVGQLQSAKAMRSGVLDANTAQKLQPQVAEALNTGLAQLGLGGVIGGYGAYSQYGKGRQMEMDTQKRIEDAVAMAKQASIQYRGRTFPGYNQPIASDKKNKKKMVLAKKDGKVKLVHFGQKGYKHNYSKGAKKNYLTRSAGIRNKSGELTMNDKHSPNYWSRKVLWPKRQKADGAALKKK